jgi:[ribosomal protein S5]-alanine N-acetyltransferase
MATDDFPTLATPRLRLRELAAADAPALLAIHGDPVVMKWFGNDPLSDLAGAEKAIENFVALRQLAAPGVRWGIETKASEPAPDALVGTCGFFRWNRGWRVCMAGYELAQHAQGRGYMREALVAAFGWAFEHMAVERIEAQVHPDNRASLTLLKRLGFADEGLQREAAFWGGRRHDMVMLGLLRREFVAG